MNKVLVSGYALGTEIDLCQACNHDYEWVIAHPSTLMWADKILVSNLIWETIQHERGARSEQMSRVLKLLFEYAYAEGIITKFEVPPIIDNDTADIIESQVERDVELLFETFPDAVSLLGDDDEEIDGKMNPRGIVINGVSYCLSHIASIYTALYLSKALEANCLFGQEGIQYCSYKFGLARKEKTVGTRRIRSFTNIFETALPNISVMPHFAYTHEVESLTGRENKCKTCEYETKCRDSYLSELEAKLKQIFRWRQYDEVQQINHEVNKIVDMCKGAEEEVTSNDIVNAFKSRQETISKRIRSVFPRVKRWSSLATFVSTPAAIVGAASSSTSLTLGALSLGGASTMTNKLMDYFENKYKWVTFFQEHKNVENLQTHGKDLTFYPVKATLEAEKLP